MGVSMSTLVGWVAVLGLFGGYAFREWSRSRQVQRVRRDVKDIKPKESKPKESKPKESKPKAKTNGPPAPAAKPKAATPTSNPTQKAAAYSASSDDDKASNLEFARQLASVKQGTKYTGKAKNETRQKSVKQSRAEEAPVGIDSGRGSAPSSTAGIDADDDRSSDAASAAASPVLGPTEAGNVDDMLEKTSPGPNVLRLTGTEEKPNYKNKKPKASPEPTETKKQRQNRKKAELAKVERDEAEKERKVKLEAQRRAARQAEGRAAKDGSAFMAAQAKQNNAWTGSGATNGVMNGSAPASSSSSTGTNGFVAVQPLDTFDSNAVQTDASKSSVQSYDKGEDWVSSLPSEEEQMEMLRKEDTWSTVKTKGRKAKKSESATVEAPSGVPTPKPAPAVAAPAPAAVQTKARPAAVASNSSFAALTVDGGAEEEEEWDV